MSDEAFVVVKVGVYRHNIHGIFSTPEKAVDCAVKICKEDEDDYHEYVIYQATIDEQLDDAVHVATVKRNDPWKHKYGQSVDQIRWLRVFQEDGRIIDIERGDDV